MKESFFGVSPTEHGPKHVEKMPGQKQRPERETMEVGIEDVPRLLKENLELQEQIDTTRAIWLSNLMRIEAAFKFNDTVADERLDILRPERNKWAARLLELDEHEVDLKDQRKTLESFLSN